VNDTDFQILGRLFQHPLDGPQAIAREVGLTRNAVSRRIRLLEASPVHLMFFALPHQDLFGRESVVNLYMAPGDVDERAVWASGDILAFDQNHDGLVAVTTWTKHGTHPEGLDHALGGAPIAQYHDVAPGPEAPYLSRLEWRVLRALMHDPRASNAKLARDTGLAARTCARARERLVTSNAIRLGINIYEDHSNGFPIYRLYVQGGFSRNAVAALLGPDTVISDTVAEGCVYFAKAPSLGAIMATVERVKAHDGVDDVKLILSTQNRVNWAWIDRLILQQLEAKS